MQTSSFPFNNQQKINVLPKQIRHNRHKDPEYKKKWLRAWHIKNPNYNRSCYQRKRKVKTLDELLRDQIYHNWFKCFASPKNFRQGVNKQIKNKKKLKQVYNWKQTKWESKPWYEVLKTHNASIVLGLENDYDGYRLGVLDVEVRGYTGLFKGVKYVSNIIGSVHFYFLYKNQDIKTMTGKSALIMNDFKADLKFNGYVMAPLSLHPTGNLYRIKSLGRFYFGTFEKASQVKEIIIKQVSQLQSAREAKK